MLKIILSILFCTVILSAAAETPPLYFTQAMMESHLAGYDSDELSLIEKDVDVVRSVCFTGKETHRPAPVYLATAGAPGARKSTILERFIVQHPEFSQAVYLDPDQRGLRFMVHTYYGRSLSALASAQSDDYALVRKAAYEKWRGASNYLTLKLLEEAFANRMDIAHGTTNTGGHLPAFFERLKEEGYRIVLLLCFCEDSFRYEAITFRNQKQFFYQSTPEDDVAKGKFFPQKMAIYFDHADTLYLYWSDSLDTMERLAAIYEGGVMRVCDEEAYQRIIHKYEEDCSEEGVSLFTFPRP